MPDITKNTTVTTALAISLCAGAFYIGGQVEGLRSDISIAAVLDGKEETQTNLWRDKTTEILDELKQMTRDNKLRIDMQEERRDR